MEQEEEKKTRRNKVSFHNKANEDEKFDAADQVGLAFRKSALSALNQDQIMYKKIEMSRYVEELRMIANKEIQDFFEAIDPNTAPKNLKLLYFYFVGSRNLGREMVNESIAQYKSD